MTPNPEHLTDITDLAPDGSAGSSAVYQSLLDTLAQLVDDAVAKHTEPLADELARLRTRIQRPDLQKYSVEEAAERLGRSRSGLYQLIKEGEIVPVKERGRTFLTEEALQRWERVQRN